ncbi:phosphatidate cytidylyltransferase [Fundicoccus culcitae]|uniref:Phosphatidate cytidylyltransferase n=1 Tax=Fundicoccus culcitae TaxID=2969821 RepID=A0ABY5P869_9LACT|nr:phosphatidate cytidylyltransferase [Fundicoccus culcitae]UUX34638.1 phosphatidate cytidylyltransferase [Fundicoccus culcitae]
MKTRIISAIVAFAIFIPFLFAGGYYFAYLMLVLGAIGLYELARMKKIEYFNIIGIISTIALAFVLLPDHYFLSFLGRGHQQFIFYIFCIILLVFTVIRHETFNFEEAAVLVFSILYIGFGFRFLISIRDMGVETIFYLFAVIWSTDIGAYFIGKAIGKNKLAPAISPNKTVEGFLGGLLSAFIVGSLYIWIVNPNLGGANHVWILTIALSLVGQLGDLVESAYKRHFGVKDSGKLIPGHGGVLDRFDSTIFASFMMIIWLNFFR